MRLTRVGGTKRMEPELVRISQRSRSNPEEKFTSLMGRVKDLNRLRESFQAQSRKKAPGIDGVRKEDYAVGVEAKLEDLSNRIGRMAYRPPPVRRTYIPKTNGGQRPLGIPTFESRIVQDRVAKVLVAIFEPEFRDSSYGYRAGRSQHDALRAVHETITKEGITYVVEADIKGFFNNVAHDHLMSFIERRIGDPNFLRLVRRFLRAGTMEDGAYSASIEGTPQGGLISPVLSNIYLHYVLDVWFEEYASGCQGRARLIRYADDFIACFEYQEDAERYYVAMQQRLKDYALEIEPTKTCIIPFGLTQPMKLAGTFNFLGLTHHIATSRTGQAKLGRKTMKKKVQTKLKEVRDKLRKMRNAGTAAITTYVRQHLQGHINYYGVSDNYRSISTYSYRVRSMLYKWLNRRSNRRSCTWEVFGEWYTRLKMPKPCIRTSFYNVAAR